MKESMESSHAKLKELADFISATVIAASPLYEDGHYLPPAKPAWFKTKRHWTSMCQTERIFEACAELSYRLTKDKIKSTAVSTILGRKVKVTPFFIGTEQIPCKMLMIGTEDRRIAFEAYLVDRDQVNMKLMDIRRCIRQRMRLSTDFTGDKLNSSVKVQSPILHPEK